jgi:hypothetical protein
MKQRHMTIAISLSLSPSPSPMAPPSHIRAPSASPCRCFPPPERVVNPPPPCLHSLLDPPVPCASRGCRRRGDSACFPPSPARYGVCLPRRGAQQTTTDAEATPNASSRRHTTFWLGKTDAQEIPAPRRFGVA